MNQKWARESFATLTILLGAAAVGCQRTGNAPPDMLQPQPIAQDAAMQQRDWEVSDAQYARTGVLTQPTLETWAPADQTNVAYEYLEIPLFLVNILESPYAAFKQTPWKDYEQRAATVEPTYTAMPPMPPPTQADENPPPEPPMLTPKPSDRPGVNPINNPTLMQRWPTEANVPAEPNYSGWQYLPPRFSAPTTAPSRMHSHPPATQPEMNR